MTALEQRRMRTYRAIIILLITICAMATVSVKLYIELRETEHINILQSGMLNVADAHIKTLQDQVKTLEEQNTKVQQDDVVSRGLPRVSGSFKSWMDYRTITDKTSKQWDMQKKSTTNNEGLRMYQGRYIVAMGTYYGEEIGSKYRIYLSSGKEINVIVGDIKSDAHTDSNKQYTRSNKSIIEFIVDVDRLSDESRRMGTITEFDGNVDRIEEVR